MKKMTKSKTRRNSTTGQATIKHAIDENQIRKLTAKWLALKRKTLSDEEVLELINNGTLQKYLKSIVHKNAQIN